MADVNAEQLIQTKVQGVLASTPYAASSLTKLTGGTGNFLFHASLHNAPPDCADGVVVKQGEAYVASNPNFPLSTSRCAVEEEALVYLKALPPSNSPACSITTPKLYYYNRETFTQVQEYLPNAVNLKTYALEHFKAPTSESHKQPCQQLGHALGVWLRSFHDWGQRPDQTRLREILAKNKEMQQLKLWVNYQVVAGMADSHPDILGDVKEELVEMHKMAAAELESEDTLHAIHGDFWTGNVLLPNAPLEDGKQIPIKIIDWELSQLATRPLDLGQMIAELWQLKLYKDIDAGEWLIKAFVDGYGDFDEDFAFRVILHVGIHLICFGSRTPGWGTKEQNIDLIRTGKEVVMKAWRKDRQGFDGHILGYLLGKATKSSS